MHFTAFICILQLFPALLCLWALYLWARAAARLAPVAEIGALESAQGSPFTRTLAACAEAGDYTSLTALLRGMSPAAVDAELRAMQVPRCLAGCHLMGSALEIEIGRLAAIQPRLGCPVWIMTSNSG